MTMFGCLASAAAAWPAPINDNRAVNSPQVPTKKACHGLIRCDFFSWLISVIWDRKTGRVQGVPHAIFAAHWDHEPDRARPRPRNQEEESRTRTRTTRRTKGSFMGREPLSPLLVSESRLQTFEQTGHVRGIAGIRHLPLCRHHLNGTSRRLGFFAQCIQRI